MSKNIFSRHARTLGVVAGLALAGASQAQAQTPAGGERNVRGFLGLGITGGGDKLDTVRFDNGTSSNLKAGGEVDVRGGIDWRASASGFGVLASVGYHVARVGGSNGGVSFSRYPVEAIGYWKTDNNLRFGLGVRRPGTAKLSGTGVLSAPSVSFKSNTSMVGEGEWLASGGSFNYGIAVRYATDKYTAPNGLKVDGSHAGVRFNWYF
jgi:hypothetical protein